MAKKKTKKKKIPSIKVAKKKAWDAFSRFIRLRDTDPDGYIRCVTCGTPKLFTQTDAGHWLSRGWTATLFEESNVHGQCKPCNGFKGGRPDDMERYIATRYGIDEVERLRALKHRITKRSWVDYDAIRIEYIAKYDELMESRDALVN